MRGRRHSTRSRAWHVVWGGEGRGGGLGSAIYPLLCAVTTAWIEKWLSHGAISRPPRWCGPWPQWRPSPSFVQTLGQICSFASWSKILEQFSPRMLYGANLMHTISSPQFGIFAKCFKYFDIKNCQKKVANVRQWFTLQFPVCSVPLCSVRHWTLTLTCLQEAELPCAGQGPCYEEPYSCFSLYLPPCHPQVSILPPGHGPLDGLILSIYEIELFYIIIHHFAFPSLGLNTR